MCYGTDMEELFDICDPQGHPNGTVAPRSNAHREGLWHRSAHLWIVDGRGRILLQQRHPNKQTDPSCWDIAVAGHVSAGQTPREAAVREAFEELGLEVVASTLVPLGVRCQEYRDGSYWDREWQHGFGLVWSGELDSLVLQADEVVAIRWIDQPVYRDSLLSEAAGYVNRRADWPDFIRWVSGL